MSITAKFAGYCKKCGESFAAGTEINWEKGKGSSHVKCPGTVVRSKVPLNSPGRAALQGRGNGDFHLGEKTEIVLGYTMSMKPNASDLGDTILCTKGEHKDKWLTSVGLGAHWVSQDEADDFDLVGPGGSFERHWSVLKYFRMATEEEAAAAAARKRQKEQEKQFDDLCNYNRGEGWEYVGYNLSPIQGEISEQVRIWKRMVGYSLHQAWRTNLGLVTYHPVYDDSPVVKLLRWETMTPEVAEMVRNAAEVAQ